MKRTVVLFVALVGLVFATGRVFVLDFQGSYQSNIHISMWNDGVLVDSICRTELGVDSVMSFFGAEQDTGYINNILWEKYHRPFIDMAARVANLDTLTQNWNQILDTNDILVVFVRGHGDWTQISGRYFSFVQAWEGLYYLDDSTMASFVNRLNCYKMFIFGPCGAFGNGRHPDSSGFATHLWYWQPESVKQKTVFLSGAGPQPRWSTMVCDDRPAPGQQVIYYCENESYSGTTYYHAEFLFHILTGFNGGAEPSEYWSHNGAPGAFKDSIDTNHDNYLTIAEVFAWDRRRSTRLGYEDNQMLGYDSLTMRFAVWPRIEILESVGITEPQVPVIVEPEAPLFVGTIVSRATFLNQIGQRSVRVFNSSGQRVDLSQISAGIYLYQLGLSNRIYKITLIN